MEGQDGTARLPGYPVRVSRFFNTTGPCDPARHYMLPAERRVPELDRLVEREQYFVLHAARQTGKTTAMLSAAARLRARGLVAVWATLEATQGIEDLGRAEPLWIDALARGAAQQLPPAQQPPPADPAWPEGARLGAWLGAWAARLGPVPLVLLLDEADVLSGPALVSLLRQLRAGFTTRRPGVFPVSVGLIGMRDLRDYLTQAKGGASANPGSPFNVKAASLTLRNFTQAEVAELYAQHSADTGQIFTPEALRSAWWWTQGQPYLVNALAQGVVDELLPDRAVPVQAEHIDAARERLILARTTHLDSLAVRLREPRVAYIVQAVLLGDDPQRVDYTHDDFRYAEDLGLIRQGPDGAEVANPLYREVLGRELSTNLQRSLPSPRFRWQDASGGLNMGALVDEFLRWWRANAAVVEEHADRNYLEAVPHLAFMAFLQKVVNGGGRVHREFAAGRGAVDLVVEVGGVRHVVELKRVPPRHRTREAVVEVGVRQLVAYLDSLGEREGWLVVFDQRPGLSWEQRLWREERGSDGRVLHLRGA